MKKLVMMMAMAAAGAAFGDYAYLYWEVNPPTGGDPWLTEGREFDYAYLRAVDQGGNVIGDPIRNYDSSGQPVGGVADVWTDPNPALRTDAPVFGDISAYASSLYGFVVEAYLGGDILWTSGAKWYDDLVAGKHVWSGDPSAMSGDLAVATYMVPEPSSALLLLLGLAGLALKRKRATLLCALVAAGFCFGAANDTILTFSTQGPDTYGDGSTVLDGERYALVWTKDGTAFAGLSADCTPLAETTKVIAVAPLAKGGRCPETVFEIDADFAETLKGGSFALYLLDTRVSKTELAKSEKLSVNAVGRVFRDDGVLRDSGNSKDSIAATSGFASVKADAVKMAEVGVYTKIEEPTIAAMEVKGAKIELTVSGMSGAADYMVVQGAEPGKVGSKMTTTVEGDKLIVDRPTGGATFFRVLGTRKFK